jgi:hypothetical protein
MQTKAATVATIAIPNVIISKLFQNPINPKDETMTKRTAHSLKTGMRSFPNALLLTLFSRNADL